MLYKTMLILFLTGGTIVFEYYTMVKVEQIRMVNAFVEITISLLGAYLFIWEKPIINKKIVVPLDIGFFLFFVSMMIDSLDQFFIHGEGYTALLEKCTLMIGICCIIYGIGKWIIISQELNQSLIKKSITDDLTRLFNRRGIMNHLAKLKKLNSSTPCSFIVMDIDDFKEVNDKHGHFVGDRALQKLGSYFKSVSEENWHVGRWGGEEFIIILKNTAIHEAIQIAESIRVSVQKINPLRENDDFKLTLSIGVTQFNKSDKSFLHAVGRADKLLYKAKQSGKNTVVSELERKA